jgi:RHS repeat-associated protein
MLVTRPVLSSAAHSRWPTASHRAWNTRQRHDLGCSKLTSGLSPTRRSASAGLRRPECCAEAGVSPRRGCDLTAGPCVDPATGLDYDQARWYDQTTGQFITSDPLNAVTQQPYSYANDDPANEVDPLGLFGWNPISDIEEAGGDLWSAVGHGLAAPVVDVAASGACIAFPEACPFVIAANTGVQELLVAAQKEFTPGYSWRDAFEAQIPIVTGDALAGLGGWAADLASSEDGYFGSAADYEGLGYGGKVALTTTVGAPQVLLDGALAGTASGSAFDCSP